MKSYDEISAIRCFGLSLGVSCLTPRCEGPPTTAFIFDIANVMVGRKPVNETWPGMYRWMQIYNGWGYCGVLGDGITDGSCCLSSMDTSETDGYGSMSYTNFQDEQSLPAVTKNVKYCSIRSTVGNVRQTLVKDQDVCVDQKKCFQNQLCFFNDTAARLFFLLLH